MGVSSLLSQSKNKMKFLLVVALLAGVQAEAEPEADPQLLLYGGVGAVAHVPTVKVVETPAEVKTVVNAVPYVLTHPGVVGYTGYTGLHYPYSPLGYPYGLGYHGGLLGYHGYLGYPYLLPAVTAAKEEEEAPAVAAERKRREAEPEAEPEADPAILASYSRVLTAPTPIIHAPAVHAAYSAPLTYAAYGFGYPYAWGK